jgi:hypothetical protein
MFTLLNPLRWENQHIPHPLALELSTSLLPPLHIPIRNLKLRLATHNARLWYPRPTEKFPKYWDFGRGFVAGPDVCLGDGTRIEGGDAAGFVDFSNFKAGREKTVHVVVFVEVRVEP